MSWLRYSFSFQGRVNRTRYWRFILLIAFLELTFAVAAAVLERLRESTLDNPTIATVEFVSLIALAAAFVPVGIIGNFAVTTKRLHDRNKSGWWQIVGIVSWLLQEAVKGLHDHGRIGAQVFLGGTLIALVGSLVGIWIVIEVAFVPGTRGDNRFGPDPLASPG
jgi:uncharacterized membrane protein YhaH (DUF805 family)